MGTMRKEEEKNERSEGGRNKRTESMEGDQ